MSTREHHPAPESGPADAGEWYDREDAKLREVRRQLAEATDPNEIDRLRKKAELVAYVGD